MDKYVNISGEKLEPEELHKPIIKVDDIKNEDLKKWLTSLGFRNGNKKILITEEEGKGETNYRVKIFTEKHQYTIVANGERYLGCVMTNRSPWPGENHTRSSDLPDGKFSHGTWVEILTAIVAHESLEIKV